MSDFISSFFSRFKLFSEASADVLPKDPPPLSHPASPEIGKEDSHEVDYYIRPFDPDNEEGSNGYGDWKSENIESYCNLITNNFRSNKFLCPISTDFHQNKILQTCKKRVNGEEPKVEHLNDFNFEEEDYNQLSAEWIKLKRPDRAAQAACFAIEANKENPVYYASLSVALFLRLNRITVEKMAPDAIEISQAEIYLDPENPNAHFRLAQLEKKTADELAKNTDTKALNTANSLYWEAINTFQTAIGFSNSREEAAEFYYQAGEAWLAKADVSRELKRPNAEISQALDNAISDFYASLENHPEGKNSFALAKTLQKMEESKEENGVVSSAEAKKAEWTIIADYYSDAMNIDKAGFQNPENILILTEALKKAERFSEARDWLKILIKRDRHNPELLFELGTMEEKLGNRRRARVAYYRAKKDLIRQGENQNPEMMTGILDGLSRTRSAFRFAATTFHKAVS